MKFAIGRPVYSIARVLNVVGHSLTILIQHLHNITNSPTHRDSISPTSSHVHRATNKRRRGLGELLRRSVAIRIVEGDVLAFEVTEIAQPVTEGVPVERVVDNADARDLPRLLRARRERPGRCAAEQRDELAPPHVDFALTLIASSASACHPASLSFIRATSVILPSATMRSACADASPARTSSISSSAVNPFANISASVQPSGEAASSSRAGRRAGLRPVRRRRGAEAVTRSWKDTTPRTHHTHPYPQALSASAWQAWVTTVRKTG